MIKFYIYLLTIGSAKYVGKTTQDPKQRLNQHLALLMDNDHHTDKLQYEWNKNKKYKHKILHERETFFKAKIALLEQRAINKYSNCNEAIAAKNSAYSFKELFYDAVDFTWRNWFLVLIGLFILERLL